MWNCLEMEPLYGLFACTFASRFYGIAVVQCSLFCNETDNPFLGNATVALNQMVHTLSTFILYRSSPRSAIHCDVRRQWPFYRVYNQASVDSYFIVLLSTQYHYHKTVCEWRWMSVRFTFSTVKNSITARCFARVDNTVRTSYQYASLRNSAKLRMCVHVEGWCSY